MAHRPFVGVLAAFLMANASLGGTAMACATPDGQAEHVTGHQVTAPVAPSHEHHSSATLPQALVGDNPATPGGAPSVPNCCKALAPCTSAAAVAVVATIDVSAAREGNAIAHGARAPASLDSAPEPPPPKA